MEIYNERSELAVVHAGYGAARANAQTKGAAPPDCLGDETFAQALRDDSNQELDWLWTYVQVTRDEQRRYCLERALAINPKSEMAQRELARLGPAYIGRRQAMTTAAKLCITETDRTPRIVELAGMATIGRASDSDVVIDAATVSHRHALLSAQPEGVVLIDLGSTNGSFVNGVQAPPDDVVWLADGDVITLGGVVLRYLAPAAADRVGG